MRRILIALPWFLALQPCLGGIITVNNDMTIAPGDVYDGIDVVDSPPHQTTISVLGGTTTSLRILDSAIANIYGGTVLSLSASDHTTLNLFGLDRSMGIGIGGSAKLNLFGHAHQSVFAGGASAVSMYQGSAVASLGMRDSASAVLHGGSIDGVLGTQGASDVHLYKVDISEYLIAGDQSTVRIYGSSFTYSPTGGNIGMGLIQGFWLDGTPLSISLSRGPDGTTDTFSHIVLLPEPATLAMFALIGLAAMRRSSQKVSG